MSKSTTFVEQKLDEIMRGRKGVNRKVQNGEKIRRRLNENKLTSVWLISQLSEHGIVTEKSELSSILAGTRNGPKVEEILRTATQILDKYETEFGRVINHDA